MKQFFVFLIFCFILVFSPKNIGAQQPGFDCGVALEGMNKCCYRKPTQVELPKINTSIPGVNGAVDGLKGFVNFTMRPFFSGFDLVSQNYVPACTKGTPDRERSDPNCKCTEPTGTTLTSILGLCNGVGEKERPACVQCIEQGKGVWTGLGCVKANARDFIQETILVRGIQLAGILALFCIMYAAFTMQTSRANPEKIKKAQELLTSCIMGLLLIIFSVLILRIIGVNILRIPGFGG